MFANDVIIDHQDRSCPVLDLNSKKCSWTGNYDQIENHLKEKHRDRCYEYVDQEMRTVKDFHKVGIYFKFIFAFNEVFFQRFVRRGDMFYVSVYYIGHTENAGKYQYKVEFVNSDNTECVAVKRLTTSFDKTMNDLQKSGNCWKLLWDVVSHLTNEQGDLNYKTEILRFGN
jgi:hypothetical protein